MATAAATSPTTDPFTTTMTLLEPTMLVVSRPGGTLEDDAMGGEGGEQH